MIEHLEHPFLGDLERLYPLNMGCSGSLHTPRHLRLRFKVCSMVFKVSILRSGEDNFERYICENYKVDEGFLILFKPNIQYLEGDGVIDRHFIETESVEEFTTMEVNEDEL